MNTQPYDYYLLLFDINKALGDKNKDALKDIEKKITEFKKRWGEPLIYQSLQAKYQLVRLELEDRQGKKNDILDEINKAYFNIYTDYPEPKKSIL
jgi:ACT domain-containing protein